MKSGKAHSVEVSGVMLDALRQMHRAASQGEDGTSIIPRGRVFDFTNFRRKWAGAVKGAGLDDFRFHDLRHTFASWARMGGADLLGLRDAMDHSSVAVTQRYAHITPADAMNRFKMVGSLVTGAFFDTEPGKTARNGQTESD